MREHLTDSEREALLGKLPILRFFDYEHLPADLQHVSGAFHDLAWEATASTVRGTIRTRAGTPPRAFSWDRGVPRTSAELAAGLRKLLEAKDCFVRAHL